MLSAVAFPLAFIVVSILYSMLTAAPFPRHARPHLHVRPPQSAGPYRGMVLPGELVYQDRTTQVPRSGVDQGLIRDLGSLINRVVAVSPVLESDDQHPHSDADSHVAMTMQPIRSTAHFPTVDPANPATTRRQQGYPQIGADSYRD